MGKLKYINLKMTSILLRISRALLVVFTILLILVIPQLNIQEYVLPTITTKTIYFLYGCMILFGLFTLVFIFSKEIVCSFTKIDIALFILVLYITLNRYFFQSRYGFSIRYIELLGLSFFYVILRTIAVKNYPWLLLSIVVSGIMQAVFGNLQLLGYYPSNHSGFKMTGSFFNPGPYAGFLVCVWSVALGMYLFKDNIITKVQSQINNKIPSFNIFINYLFEYIPLLGIISIAVVLPALQSRASWIAAIVSSVILLELKYHFLKLSLKKVSSRFQKTAIITISVFILIMGLFSLYHFKKASSDGRTFIWKVTTEIIKDYPLFGVGFDRFNAYYMNYQANYFTKNGESLDSLVADNNYYAFNEGLQFVSENGFLGFVLLLFLGFVLFQPKVKKEHQFEALIVKTGILTIGVFACFSYPVQILPIKLVLVFLLSMLSKKNADSFQFGIDDFSSQQWMYKTVLLLLCGFCMNQIFSYTNKLSQGLISWNTALISHQYGDYKNAIVDFETVYPIFNKNGDFLMNYGKTLSMTNEHNKAIKILNQAQYYQNNTIIATALGDSYKATRDYDKAELAYQQAINMIPGKFYANYLLAKLYDDSKQKEKAIAQAQRILKKEIKIPSTAIKEIQGEMKKILIKYKNPPGF